MKRSTKFLAILLSLVMVLALLPMGTLAIGGSTTDAATPNWKVSKSKTATALNDAGETTVTLSLPSAEEQQGTDVEIVADMSSCAGEVAKQVASLVNELYAAQQKSQASIKFGVVAFKGCAAEMIPLAKLDQTTVDTWAGKSGYFATWKTEGDVETYLKQNFPSLSSQSLHGSNLPAGVALGKSALDADNDSNVSTNHKYLITVTDGLTYLFNNASGQTTGIFNNGNDGSPASYACLFYQWQIGNNMHGFTLPTGFNWDNYYANVVKNVASDNGKYDITCTARPIDEWRFVGPADSDYSNFEVGRNVIDCCKDNTGTVDPTKCAAHAFGIDRSVYETIQLYNSMFNSSTGVGYQLYTINPTDATNNFGSLFTSELNKLAGKSDDIDFTEIKNDILYTIGTGTVTDTIGNDFNFEGLNSLVLTKGGVVLPKTPGTGDNANTVYFGAAIDNSGYPYSVTYTKTDSGKQLLVWNINVKVENLNRMQLSYTLKLANKSTTPGTYGVDDLDGSKGGTTGVANGLFTNESAVLTYLPSNATAQTVASTETFNKPSVSYTVSGDIIINPNPTPTTTDIPEPSTPLAELPEDLNSTDHITYIAGYPDGTVRPKGQITRAEVATAFYRLLTAARRDAVFTATPAYSDMNASQWFNKAVSSMANGKYVTGYPNGTFGGNKSITRAEFVAIAARFMNAKAGTVTFTDVSSSNWAYQYISTAVAYGWINGYPDGSFKPNQPITRAEAMKIINTMLARGVDAAGLMAGAKTWPDNANTAMWYYYEVEEATNNHLYTGTRPSESWTSLTTSYVYDMAKYERP